MNFKNWWKILNYLFIYIYILKKKGTWLEFLCDQNDRHCRDQRRDPTNISSRIYTYIDLSIYLYKDRNVHIQTRETQYDDASYELLHESVFFFLGISGIGSASEFIPEEGWGWGWAGSESWLWMHLEIEEEDDDDDGGGRARIAAGLPWVLTTLIASKGGREKEREVEDEAELQNPPWRLDPPESMAAGICVAARLLRLWPSVTVSVLCCLRLRSLLFSQFPGNTSHGDKQPHCKWGRWDEISGAWNIINK